MKLIEKEETDPNMVGRNWFTISNAAIISLIIINSTLRGEEEKKRENKGCICRSSNRSFILTLPKCSQA